MSISENKTKADIEGVGLERLKKKRKQTKKKVEEKEEGKEKVERKSRKISRNFRKLRKKILPSQQYQTKKFSVKVIDLEEIAEEIIELARK